MNFATFPACQLVMYVRIMGKSLKSGKIYITLDLRTRKPDMCKSRGEKCNQAFGHRGVYSNHEVFRKGSVESKLNGNGKISSPFFPLS
jgi:hypothetical protein